MGWDEIERSWNELKGEVKRQWSKLTDEDVELIKGKYAELLSLLQERYGQAKEQAEREINDWARRLKAYSAAELTELRDDVASLSASVGELVRRQAVGGVLAVIALVLIVSFLGSKPSSSDEERLEPFFSHRLTP